MVRVLVVLWMSWIAAACGRIGFDVGAGGDAGDGSDAGSSASVPDAQRAACVPQAELCNGVDDSCDGEIDEDCPCQPFDLMVGTSYGGPVPQIAWTGMGYGLLLEHDSMIDLAIVDPFGDMIVSRTINTIATPRFTIQHGVVWTGSELVAVWEDDSGGYLGRFSASGLPVAPPVALEDAPLVIAWAGDRLVGASLLLQGRLGVRELALDGTLLRELTVMHLGSLYISSLAVTDDYYAISYHNSASSYVRVDRAAWTIGSLFVPFIGSGERAAQIAARPDGTLALTEVVDGVAYLHPLDADAMAVGAPIVIPPLASNSPTSVDAAPFRTGFRVVSTSSTEAWSATFDARSQTFSPPQQSAVYPPLDGVFGIASIGAANRQAFTLGYSAKGAPSDTVRLIQTCL